MRRRSIGLSARMTCSVAPSNGRATHRSARSMPANDWGSAASEASPLQRRVGGPCYGLTPFCGGYLALSGNVPHMPPMINHVSPSFIHVCVIFDSLPLPSTFPSG